MIKMLQAAKAAKAELAGLTAEDKNRALRAMADALVAHTGRILEANALDVQCASAAISPVMLDRLLLTQERIAAMADGIYKLIDLPDPTGQVLDEYCREDGLLIRKVSVPIGVIAIIYESRPNVTSDAVALALKSGNVCILRSGKEALRSAIAIVEALRAGLRHAGVTEHAVNLVTDPTRDSAVALMTAREYVDLLIPRGGTGLISACMRQATVPCIATGTGICHIYVHRSADPEMALRIIENAKASRPSVCNAAEVLLVDRAIAASLLPRLHSLLVTDRAASGRQPVKLLLDKAAGCIIPGTPAGPEDFDTEFLDYTLAVRCVEGGNDAIAHIAAHSTGHSEAIVASDQSAIDAFVAAVDSAAVYVNASTRFTDGDQFGLGCEMGISTQKLHARGPMGLRELTSYKYTVYGKGHIR